MPHDQINHVVILSNTDIGSEGSHLFINGAYQSSYLPQFDGSDTDEFESMADDLADLYNTEVQVFQTTSEQIAASLSNNDLSTLNMDDLIQRKIICLKDVVKRKVSFIDQICKNLEDGKSSDIWFDADEYGDKARAAQIVATQKAMGDAIVEMKRLQEIHIGPVILSKPLVKAEAEAVRDDNGRISVVVEVDFSELIASMDVEGMNNLMDGPGGKILSEGFLSDISYAIVGHKKQDATSFGSVLVQVNAFVGFSDE